MGSTLRLRVGEEVSAALQAGRAVVALESTIISHGMPFPANFETALGVEAEVRQNGAVPATIAILNGDIVVGMSAEEIRSFAQTEGIAKCSIRDLPYIISKRRNGSTTVAATSYIAHLAGIHVFATGGIGGVHRGAEITMDISNDLVALSTIPIVVVCAGIKSILDIEKTLEVLETLGVPAVTLRQQDFPAFFVRSSGIPSPLQLDTEKEVCEMYRVRKALGMKSGLLIANPISASLQANQNRVNTAIQKALQEVDDKHITGREITPYILGRVNELSDGESLQANIALIKSNARVAAQIALHLSMGALGRVLVVGAAATDVTARGMSNMEAGVSTVGAVECSFGGVALNMATALRSFGLEVDLSSAVGEDVFGKALLDHLDKRGVGRDLILTHNHPSAVVSSILHSNGELHSCIADMNGFESMVNQLCTQVVQRVGSESSYGVVIMDCNLSKEGLEKVLGSCAASGVKVVVNATTKHKIKRIPTLQGIYLLGLNAGELEALVGTGDIQLGIQQLLSQGVAHVLVSNGKEGAYYGWNGSVVGHIPVPPSLLIDAIQSANGAGDCLLAGTLFGLLNQEPFPKAIAKYGIPYASQSLVALEAVPIFKSAL